MSIPHNYCERCGRPYALVDYCDSCLKIVDTTAPPKKEANAVTKKEDIRLIPFNAKKHRHLMPFTKGHGVSIAGWQFKIKSLQPNGKLTLQCVGKILDEPAVTIVPDGGKEHQGEPEGG